MKTTRKSFVSNILWRFFERIGAQALKVLVTIIVARLLVPSDFGIIALVTVFTSIMRVFIDSGMGTALIQKKDADNLDFSSVFFFNIVVCLVLYVGMFFSAPYIATFYSMPNLVSVIRVLSLTLIISGVRNVQQAYVSRHLLFKKFFYATLGGTLVGAVIGIWMAYTGYGVWALVIQSLFTDFIGTLVLWYIVAWRPQKIFSFQRLSSLFSYGWKLLASAVLNVASRDIATLVIGKMYTPAELAFFDRGRQFPNLIINNINTAIDSVLLPAMAAEQDDCKRVRSMTRRAIKTSTYLIMPMMMILAASAEPIVRLVLTEKWLPCVFFMRISCFGFAFQPIHTANLNAIKALGRSDLFLKLEILKKSVGFGILLATMYISVEAMALGFLVGTIINQVINSWPNRTLLDYYYIDQLKDMLPQITLSCVMGVPVFFIQFLRLSDWLTLLIQIVLGASIYLCGSWMFHMDSFEYLLGLVNSFRTKKRLNSVLFHE